MTDLNQGGRSRQKTGGRRKGSANKVTATARENIIAVFQRIGGTAAMARWARANETEFYKLYARLIPANVAVEVRSLEAVINESWERPLKPLPPSLAQALPAAALEIARSIGRDALEGEFTEVKDGDGETQGREPVADAAPQRDGVGE